MGTQPFLEVCGNLASTQQEVQMLRIMRASGPAEQDLPHISDPRVSTWPLAHWCRAHSLDLRELGDCLVFDLLPWNRNNLSNQDTDQFANVLHLHGLHRWTTAPVVAQRRACFLCTVGARP